MKLERNEPCWCGSGIECKNKYCSAITMKGVVKKHRTDILINGLKKIFFEIKYKT